VSQATAEPVFETTALALQEKKKLRRHFRRFDMFFSLHRGDTRYHRRGREQRSSQIVPLAVIIVIGVAFYVLGTKTRQHVAAEPVSPDLAPPAGTDPAS
jgi:hypothetical protein